MYLMLGTFLEMSREGLQPVNMKIKELLDDFRNELTLDLKSKIVINDLSQNPAFDDFTIDKLIENVRSEVIEFIELPEPGQIPRLDREYISSFFPSETLAKFADELDIFIEDKLRSRYESQKQ